MSYWFGQPTKLDAEVAVRCFDFRWFASNKINDGGKRLCILHVPLSWTKAEHGRWIRWNWHPDGYEELPRGTIWPEGELKPFEDWHRGIGKDNEPPSRGVLLSNLPAWSKDWLACGMVIEWLQKQGIEFQVLTNSIKWNNVTIEGFATLQEGFCRLAIEVAKNKKIDFPDDE